MTRVFAILFSIVLVSITSTTAFAEEQESLADFLKRFHRSPSTVINELPPKFDQEGQRVHNSSTFDAETISDGSYLKIRSDLKKRFCKTTVEGERVCLSDKEDPRSTIKPKDVPGDLVDKLVYDNISKMAEQKLESATLVGAEQPWSDTYWPIYQGQLGARYAVSGFDDNDTWLDYFNFVAKDGARSGFGKNAPADDLSPAEKYDMLVGDAGWTLTNRMWDEGKEYWDAYGKVESWMGLCHGWAPASYMLPRPTNTIKVKSASGQIITLFPADVKGFASLLWGKAESPSHFIGGRCYMKRTDIKKDPASGRVLNEECFNTNPGTWHTAVVNQLGVGRRSFVMDATFDYEVWNQPVVSYNYSYYNPQTNAPGTLAESTIPYSAFTKDKFSKFREKQNFSHIVGVSMYVQYGSEIIPNHSAPDDPKNDAINSVRYVYDLELDKNGKIMGGEWYSNGHPDFLWTPPPGAKAETAVDAFVPQREWKVEIQEDGSKVYVLPYDASPAFLSYARRASSTGQPLARIVEKLVSLSHGE